MQVMLRTNFPEVFEQEDKVALAFNDESAYWMRALCFVEEASSDMEEWRIVQRYMIDMHLMPPTVFDPQTTGGTMYGGLGK